MKATSRCSEKLGCVGIASGFARVGNSTVQSCLFRYAKKAGKSSPFMGARLLRD